MKKPLCLLTLLFVSFTVFAQESPKYESKGKRDPLIPYLTNDGQLTNIRETEEGSSITVEGIIFDNEGQSMAIINGEIIKTGDAIAGGKIIEIRKDSVVFVKDGEISVIDANQGGG